jgi:hypothetical protein
METIVTVKDLLGHVRDANQGDPWGESMAWMFATAAKLEFEFGGAPDEWRFHPGAGTTSANWRESFESYELDMLEGADEDVLTRFGAIMNRWANKCKAAGLSY